MTHLISAGLIIAGLIHVLPLSGVLGAPNLNALYGIDLDDSNLVILMRHRAVLFALLGSLMFLAVIKTQYQPIAIISGLISTVSFLCLAWLVDDFNDHIGKVVVADVIAIVSLIIAGGAKIVTSYN